MKRTMTQKTAGSMFLTALLVAAVLFSMTPTQGNTDTPSEPNDWIEDRAVIAFKEQVPDDAHEWVTDLGGEVLLENHAIHFILAEFPAEDAARDVIDLARERSDVRHAEHDVEIRLDEPVEIVILDPPGENHLDGYTPNNPMWPDQWGPPAINAPEAWDLGLGSHDVRLGIADTGITGGHENLDANICGPHVSGSTPPLAPSGHGTHVAGIAAAEIDSGIGIAGMSQSCLMSIRVLGGGSAGLAAGITFAADNGAHAINMSFRSGFSQTFKDALDYAYMEKDVVVVKSAGNGGCFGAENPTNTAAYTSSNTMTWPGPEASVIAVAALAPPNGGVRASFSSCGNQMELAAPGQGIVAPYLDRYASLSGTSMAAPHVTGLVGLMRAANPDLTALEVRCLLGQTADDIGPVGWDPFYGWGRINAEQAVLAAQNWDGGTLQQQGSPSPCGLPIPELG